MAVLAGGIDDPDGVVPAGGGGRPDDGWELDTEERLTVADIDAEAAQE